MINLILLDGNRTFKGQTSRLYYSAISSQNILVHRIIPFFGFSQSTESKLHYRLLNRYSQGRLHKMYQRICNLGEDRRISSIFLSVTQC